MSLKEIVTNIEALLRDEKKTTTQLMCELYSIRNEILDIIEPIETNTKQY